MKAFLLKPITKDSFKKIIVTYMKWKIKKIKNNLKKYKLIIKLFF